MNKFNARVIISIKVILLILISGCATIIHKKPLSTEDITVAEIRHRVEQNYLKLHSLKAKAKVSVESPQMSFVTNSSINLKTPDSLMIKLSAIFGIGVGSVFLIESNFTSKKFLTWKKPKPPSMDTNMINGKLYRNMGDRLFLS